VSDASFASLKKISSFLSPTFLCAIASPLAAQSIHIRPAISTSSLSAGHRTNATYWFFIAIETSQVRADTVSSYGAAWKAFAQKQKVQAQSIYMYDHLHFHEFFARESRRALQVARIL
jgi:hypothetical protein